MRKGGNGSGGSSPPPLAGGGWGEGAAPMLHGPPPPTPSRQGRGSYVATFVATFVATVIVGAVTILATAPTHAQPASGWKPMTAKQLATACHSSDPAQHATCAGYVSGIYDLQFAPTP